MPHELSEEDLLGLELSEILWDFYLLKRPMPESDVLLDNMAQLRFRQLLVSSLILRLCKLRDTDTRSISFDQVVKVLQKRAATAGRVVGVAAALKKFRRLTENLEKHRDNYIAHLAKTGRSRLKPATEIRDAVRESARIVDILSGQKVSCEAFGVDLRTELGV